MEFVLIGGLLIDGTGGDPVANAALHVKDGRIVWAGPSADLPAAAKSLPQVDVSGKVVIPGLIDAHIHVCWNGRESVLDLVKRDRDLIVLEATQTLSRILASGTTTVRDIAASAEVSPGSVIHHFGSMDGLHRAEALWEAALEKLEAAESLPG